MRPSACFIFLFYLFYLPPLLWRSVSYLSTDNPIFSSTSPAALATAWVVRPQLSGHTISRRPGIFCCLQVSGRDLRRLFLHRT